MNHQITYRKLSDLRESPTNPRKHFDAEELADLAKSIAKTGVLQPIVVRETPTGPEIVVGHRRFRATKMTRLPTIPCITRELTDREVLELQIVENSQRADVRPLEEADAFQTLVERHHQDPIDIAAKLGRPVGYVRRRLGLTELEPALRDLLEADRIGIGSAEILSKLPAKFQAELTAEGARLDPARQLGDEPKSWSLAEVRTTINFGARRLRQARWPLDEPYAGCGACSSCPLRSSGQGSLLQTDSYTDGDDRCLDASCWDIKFARSKLDLADQCEAKGYIKPDDKLLGRLWDRHFWRESTRCWLLEGYPTYGSIAPDVQRYYWIEELGENLVVRALMLKSDVLDHLKDTDLELYWKVSGKKNPDEVKRAQEQKHALEERRDAAITWSQGQTEVSPELLRAYLMSRASSSPAWCMKKLAVELGVSEKRASRTWWRNRIRDAQSTELPELLIRWALLDGDELEAKLELIENAARLEASS